jgi:aspartyl-tRNA(Asn)/glutamyl-tRNA(Gln) amidotransferase subunit C
MGSRHCSLAKSMIIPYYLAPFSLLTDVLAAFMALLPEDIGRIAKLARLEFEPDQAERLRSQMNGFFGLVDAMNAVDTSAVEPLAHPFSTISEVALRLAEDQVSESNQREANQRSAPAVERGLFLVPKVIE